MNNRFFLHYNKPLSQRRGKHIWSVHYQDRCHFVENIDCQVATQSKTNKTQPYVVMRGRARNVRINKRLSKATII